MPLDDTQRHWIGRDQQVFGPYTPAEVDAYVKSGHIVPTDFIRGERDSDWTPLHQALGLAAPPPTAPPQPGGGQAGSASGFDQRYGPRSNDPYAGAPPQKGAMGDDPAFTMSVWSVGLGIVAILCCGVITAIPGLVVGVVAMRHPAGSARPLAVLGVVLNAIGLLLGILSCLFLPAILSSLSQMPQMPQ
jgi:hypothetical protein